MPLIESTIDFAHQHLDRISPKRKLADYGPGDEDISDLISVRMKKDELDAVNSLSRLDHNRIEQESDVKIRVSDARSTKALHFFVRMMCGSNSIVIHANSDDSVESVHEKIRKLTGIPIIEQRLIYEGKQLQLEQSLADCSIQNDSGLQLVGRLRSTDHPRTWQVINDLISSIRLLCSREDCQQSLRTVVSRVKEFLGMTPKFDTDVSFGHLQIFKSAGVPTALVMLFLSPITGNKECAEESIRLFLNPNIEFLPKAIQAQCAPIVFEFCRLLSRTAHDDPLYISCRNSLGSLLEIVRVANGSRSLNRAKALLFIREIFPFVCELGSRLSMCLDSNTSTFPCTSSSLGDVRDFSLFLLPLCKAIEDHYGGEGFIPISLHDEHVSCIVEILSLHDIFLELMEKIDELLKNVEEILATKNEREIEGYRLGWLQFLAILKELDRISKLYRGAEEKLSGIIRSRRVSLNSLIRHSKQSDDHLWFLKHKDVADFESRRHLLMLMFPEVKDEYEELYEMLIDRSHLLAESFEYIAHADPKALRGSRLFMEFKNEEATGPGVLREWFCLVCQALFNPQNALFLSCPDDHRRFFPNPASNVNPLHLDYFVFCGRIIALALMHRVQVGIVFDRVFLMQLAGNFVSLEDVRDADPCLYMSCKRILEMDVEILDSDDLGLTFVREIEELGSRSVVELCPGGKDIVLNSRNRNRYVNLLIQHHFVTSISEQVARFAQGFADILCNSKLQKFFFQSLELEDFDRMLHGSDRDICVKDWHAHTEYNGYKETDSQICWFWKIVEDMSAEQRRVLLFFWTSVKYLPVEGFGGLQSRLFIFKPSDCRDRLPTSHTCFYSLHLPPYQSLEVMRDVLQTITQEYVGCSFGIW